MQYVLSQEEMDAMVSRESRDKRDLAIKYLRDLLRGHIDCRKLKADSRRQSYYCDTKCPLSCINHDNGIKDHDVKDLICPREDQHYGK